MRYFLYSLLILLSSSPSNAQVNGYEEDIQGIPVIHVWGTDTEMGYALGYLDGDRGAAHMEEGISGIGAANWQNLRDTFETYFQVPERIDSLVTGMIAGAGDRPDSILYSQVLGRYYDKLDILVATSSIDLSAALGKDLDLACTSFSAWDDATAGEPTLQGAPAMARNYDGGYDSLLIEIPSVMAMNPDDGNQTVICGWTLNVDCSSGINEHGICLTRNAANYTIVTNYSSPFVTNGYANLLGLMEDDFDGSGTNDLEDLLTAITTWNIAPSRILHTAAPRSLAYNGDPAVVVEINNDQGFQFRTAADDSIMAPDHLAATNHHRLLYPPVEFERYPRLQDSVAANPDMTLDRFWDFMVCCDQGNYTFLTLIFVPESHEIGIAYADHTHEAFEKDPVWLTWEQLFPPEGIEGGRLTESIALDLFPNPSSGSITVAFSTTTAMQVEIMLYDITGRAVRRIPATSYGIGAHSVGFTGLSDGVYFCRIESGGTAAAGRFAVIAHQ